MMQQFLRRVGIVRSKGAAQSSSSSRTSEDAYAVLEIEAKELRSKLAAAHVDLGDLTEQLAVRDAKIQELSGTIAARDARITELSDRIQAFAFSGQGSLSISSGKTTSVEAFSSSPRTSPRSSPSVAATTPPLSARSRMRELGSRKLPSSIASAPATALPAPLTKQLIAHAPTAEPPATVAESSSAKATAAAMLADPAEPLISKVAAAQGEQSKTEAAAHPSAAPSLSTSARTSLPETPSPIPALAEQSEPKSNEASTSDTLPRKLGNSSPPRKRELPMARKLPPPASQDMQIASLSSNAQSPSERCTLPTAVAHDVIYDARLKEVHSGGGGTSHARAALLGESAPVEDAPADDATDRAELPNVRMSPSGLLEARARPVGAWVDPPQPMPGTEARAAGWLDKSQKISTKLKEMQAKSFLVGAASDAQRLASIDVFVESGALTASQGEKIAAAVTAQTFEKTTVEAAFECTESDAERDFHKSAALELHSDGGAILNVVDGRRKPVVWMYAFANAADESDEQTLRLSGTCISSNAIGEAASFWLEFLSDSGGWRGLVGAPDSDPGGIGARWEAEFLPS